MQAISQVNTGQFVAFTINNQVFALPIDEVVEIIRIDTITEVPGIKEYIVGVINLRGNIIPVVHLRKRLKLPETPFDRKTRIVVVHYEGENIGLILDEVKMVTHVENDKIDPALDMFDYLQQEWFRGIVKTEEGLIGILKLEKVLSFDVDIKAGETHD